LFEGVNVSGKNRLNHAMFLERQIGFLAGEPVRRKVMDGSDEITEKTSKKKMAAFVKTAMERLDASVDEETRIKIMENCGYKCAKVNKSVIDAFVARRKKFGTLDEFLEAEQRNPSAVERLERQGNIVYQFYTPQSLTRPVRCYCDLLEGLPSNETISLTYCQCSKGFIQKSWEALTGKPVRVDLLQSVVHGDKECKFAIHLP